MPTQLHKK